MILSDGLHHDHLSKIIHCDQLCSSWIIFRTLEEITPKFFWSYSTPNQRSPEQRRLLHWGSQDSVCPDGWFQINQIYFVPCRIQPDVCGSAGLSKYSYWIFQTGGCSFVRLEANDQAIFTPLSLWEADQQITWPTCLVSTKHFCKALDASRSIELYCFLRALYRSNRRLDDLQKSCYVCWPECLCTS